MFELLGFRHLDFSTDDGSSVKGDQLFVAFAEDGVTGRILISAALGRTPLLKLRPQTPPLKKENPRPAAPGERYEE